MNNKNSTFVEIVDVITETNLTNNPFFEIRKDLINNKEL